MCVLLGMGILSANLFGRVHLVLGLRAFPDIKPYGPGEVLSVFEGGGGVLWSIIGQTLDIWFSDMCDAQSLKISVRWELSDMRLLLPRLQPWPWPAAPTNIRLLTAYNILTSPYKSLQTQQPSSHYILFVIPLTTSIALTNPKYPADSILMHNVPTYLILFKCWCCFFSFGTRFQDMRSLLIRCLSCRSESGTKAWSFIVLIFQIMNTSQSHTMWTCPQVVS